MMVAHFERPCVVIVKHNNPCGVGVGEDLATAYERALACDSLSAFGSVIAVNRRVDHALAAAMAKLFVEVVTARCTPAAAFFDTRIDLEGDMEMGLKLSTVLEPFFRRFSYPG